MFSSSYCLLTSHILYETCVCCRPYNRQCYWATCFHMFWLAAVWCKSYKKSCLNRNRQCVLHKAGNKFTFCKHYNGCSAWETVSFNWFGVRLTTSPFHVTADNVEETCVGRIAYNRQCSWTTFSDMFRPATAWFKANKNTCLNRKIQMFLHKAAD